VNLRTLCVKKHWQRISEIFYCSDDYVLYVNTSASYLHCVHAKYIFSLRFQSMGGHYFGTSFILHWYWTLYQMPTYKPNLTCTGCIHNRCTKSPAVCFGTPCMPSSGSKLDVLDIVYSFCLLGDLFIYYVKYYCIINSQCV